MVFQISDIHVSKFNKGDGIKNLISFLNVELPMISPDFVAVTGDLTDAKDEANVETQQYPEEWSAYRSAIESSGVLTRNNGRFWLDQRGNHDCFNIPYFTHKTNLYRQMSFSQTEGFVYEHRKPFGVYNIISIDACPIYGIKRPFNFFSYFDKSDMDLIEATVSKGKANHTFLLSHYPTTTTLFGKSSSGKSFSDLRKEISVYLCGHFHKLYWGIGEALYGNHKDYLELELADLKDHATFRIVAIDNDIISFRDLPLHVLNNPNKNVTARPPIVLLTNPKNSKFIIPSKEDTSKIRRSSHIRMLIWTSQNSEVRNIEVRIDGQRYEKEAMYHGVGSPSHSTLEVDVQYIPLWTIEWNPDEYNDGNTHLMSLEVEDSNGLKARNSATFRVDGKVTNMHGGIGELLILGRIGLLFKFLCIVEYTVYMFLLLLIPKFFVNYMDMQKRNGYLDWRNGLSKWLIAGEDSSKKQPSLYNLSTYFAWLMFLRLCELAKRSALWYTFYGYLCFAAIGPWFIGDMIPTSETIGGKYAVFSIFGIMFFDGLWIPAQDTWYYGKGSNQTS
ncbi:Transmembrane protein 62 [Nowakowskiella sp. JEL0407]|nr:Transmembrane protein 62 [Nowakowskiella sp. JEL0407]